MNNVFLIPECNKADFLSGIAKLSKRAVKIGCEPLTAVLVGESMRSEQDWAYRVFHYQLDAKPVRITGWTFVATVDHTNDAGNIVRIIPNTGVEVPSTYRQADPLCDHCKQSRYRRDTFILHCAATNTFKQVGRQCLKDFFGHDPMKLAKYAELLAFANECADAMEEYSFVKGRNYLSLRAYLGNVAAIIRTTGWLGRAMAKERGCEGYATADIARENMLQTSGNKNKIVPTDEDMALADAAIDWGQSLNDKTTPLTDYEHNVLVVAGAEVIDVKLIGIAASMVYVYQLNAARAAERTAAEKAGTASVYVGTKGERLRDISVTLTHALTFETTYGPMTLFLFSYNGNVLKWFTAPKSNAFKVGDNLLLTATVDEHNEYKGTKQTSLKRCILKPAA